jgi:ribosome-binding factor A
LAETIKKEVFDILKNDLRDPRIGFITITNVEVQQIFNTPRFLPVFMVQTRSKKKLWKYCKKPRVISAVK